MTQTVEQLQEQEDFTIDLARRANVRLTRDLMQARAELTQRNLEHINDMKVMSRQGEELTQARDELAHAKVRARKLGAALTDACAARDALARECNHLETERNVLAKTFTGANELHAIVQGELAQARDELKDLRGANKALGQQVGHLTGNRNCWFNKCWTAEIERDKIRKEAQEQSDQLAQARDELAAVDEGLDEFYCPVLNPETDELCGSFYKDHGVNVMRQALEMAEHYAAEAGLEAEGLRQQLKKIEVQFVAVGEAVSWLWGFWDGNTLRAIPGFEDDIRKAWDNLLLAVDVPDTALQLHKRQATVAEEAAIVEAAEALMSKLKILRLHAKARGRELHYDVELTALQEALERHSEAAAKLLERLAYLNAAEAALDACGLGEFNNLANAIWHMAKRIEKLEGEPMVEVEIAGMEMVEALQAAVRKRRVAEHDAHVHGKAADELVQTLHTEGAMRLEAERRLEAMSEMARDRGSRLRIAEQRAERAEAHLAQTQSEMSRIMHEGLNLEAERDYWLGKHADAEALAALVTKETAALLERLGLAWKAPVKDKVEARALATKIREALDDKT